MTNVSHPFAPQLSLDLSSTDKFGSLLQAGLETFSLMLEVAGLPEVGKHAEELLSYLRAAVTLEATTAIHCVQQVSHYYTGYPRHRENRENGQKKSLSGKTQGIWKFCQNTGKTQGIWFAQVVISLILKVKDVSIFAAKIFIFFGGAG